MSATEHPEEPRHLSEACEAFADYLANTVHGEAVDFETFYSDRQGLAEELKSLHAEWLSSPSFRERFLQRYGEGLDPSIAQEPDGGLSSKGAAESRLKELEAHAPQAGRYSIRGEVARGGMGVILKVWDEDLRRTLAMKVVLGSAEIPTSGDTPAVSPEVLSRFLEEAQITGQLDHPGVVPVHELGIDSEERVYFTMRLVEGRELKEIVDLVREDREGWTRTRALGVIQKVCEAMAYAHSKGVIHRDLKPANVMVGKFGEVYVMDWGLAKVLGKEDTRDLRLRGDPHLTVASVRTDRREEAESDPDSPLMTMDGAILGTPSYMPPEQAEGRMEDLGPRSDVYAVGAMLYTLLTGQMPYVKPGARMSPFAILNGVLEGPPTPIHKLDPTVPAELASICEKAMTRDPADRYADMLEMADDLRAYMENRVVRAHQTGAVAELRKWVKRNRALASVSAAALVILFVGSLWYSARLRDALSVSEQRTAEKDRALRRARALSLAHASAAEVEDPMLGLLLAREAGRVQLVPEVVTRLHEALAGSRERAVIAPEQALAEEVFRCIVFSPSGDRILTAHEDCFVRTWNLRGEAITAFRAHEAAIQSLACSPSGDRILTGSADKTARVWSATGEPVAVLRGHDDVVRSAVFSPSGDWILTGSADKTARLWSREGDELAVFRHDTEVTSAVFAPTGDRIFTGSGDEFVRVWAPDGRLIRSLQGPPKKKRTGWGEGLLDWPGPVVEVSATGQHVLGSFPGGRVRLWSREGAVLATLTGVETAFGLSAHFSPAGDRILAPLHGRLSPVRMWDLSGRVVTEFRGHRSNVLTALFSPDGKRVLTAADDGTAIVWDLQGRTLAVLAGHREGMGLAFLNPRGNVVLTAEEPGVLGLWHLDQEEVSMFRVPRGISRCEVASRGDRILTSHKGVARIWDLWGNELAAIGGADGEVVMAALSPSGEYAATVSNGMRVAVWRIEGPEKIAELQGHSGRVTSVRFSLDGRRIVTTADDRTIRIWDLAGAGASVLDIPDANAQSAQLSPTGNRIITVSDDHAQIWDRSGNRLARVPPPIGRHREIVCSPSGEYVASGARIFDSSGTLLFELAGHQVRNGRSVASVRFSPNNDRLVSAGYDGTARIWDLSGRQLAVLRSREGDQTPRKGEYSLDRLGPVFHAAFARSGRVIVTATKDGTVRVWVARGKDLLEFADGRILRDFTAEERRRYAGLLSEEGSE